MQQAWHFLDPETVAAELQTDLATGLTPQVAEQRLARYGPNELIDRGVKSVWVILWAQLTDVMVLLLIVAAIISAFIGEISDTFVILAIVVLNTLLGLTQEYRAERAIAELKKLAVPNVRVRRGGHVSEISARTLVPGDLVLLEAGNVAPADGRLVEVMGLRVEEAALTGESEPVEKQRVALPSAQTSVALPSAQTSVALPSAQTSIIPIGDQVNMVFMGTVITYGRGVMVVTATGMATELGHIAGMLQNVGDEATPLQRRLEKLGQALAAVAVVIIVVVFGMGLLTSSEVREIWASQQDVLGRLLRSESVRELFLTAISLAVAAVPEGLPAMVTIALALGSRRMLRRKALIRKLPAVETLGSVTTICSDKTGTLTQNQMTVTILDVAGEQRAIETLVAAEFDPANLDGVTTASPTFTPTFNPTLQSFHILLQAAALCNDSALEHEADGTFKLIGDPTETALVRVAAEFQLEKAALEAKWPRVAEAPFTSERKCMTTIHQVPTHGNGSSPFGADATYVAFVKGGVDVLLAKSSLAWLGDHSVPLTVELRGRIQQANAQLAQAGQRVLGVAFRPLAQQPTVGKVEQVEEALVFVGLIGMIDPPREEVKMAVATCRSAGIRPVMITGDHPLTALAIARQLGITDNDQCLTGYELADMDEEALQAQVEQVSVYARVAPEHKLNIVNALQQKGHVVAMTGDGVNDAPALKQADIGVAMGITGTDVSKEAADMVLLDDNFATIVAATEEGRTIYDNIRKFIRYLLSSNIGEIFVMLVAPFLGMPLPLLPIHILWINLVTDGLPGLALSLEQPERGIMQRKPIPARESIFSRGLGVDIVWVGCLLGILSLAVGYWGFVSGVAITHWRTMVFTTLTFTQMGNALSIRSSDDLLVTIGIFSNRLMIGAVILTVVLQLMLLYIPFFQRIFNVAPLTGGELFICFFLSFVLFGIMEGVKWLRRRQSL
ncbi:MAG: cation-translocating P-type ATPase [Caldilineaceae bacterium]|nr:cation-translocating P-type ATPase [Caldilineaceae bacterium]